MQTSPTTKPLSKLFKLRMPVDEWEKLNQLAQGNRRSVNSEILTAIESYTTRELAPRRKQ